LPAYTKGFVMTRRFSLASFLALLAPCLGVPAQAQTTPTTAPPRLVFTPQSARIPAGVLTFTPNPAAPAAVAALNAQVSALSAQNSTLSSQNTGLQAQVAATAPTVYGQPFPNRFTDASPSGPHLVWLHEVMSQSEWGRETNLDPYDGSTSVSVAQATQQIQEAMSYGCDGDAMDIQGTDHTFTSAVENTLTAGDIYKGVNKGASNGKGVTDFTSFLQFDFATYPQDTASIVAQINQSIKHPSYARHLGLPIVSTYSGEGGTYAEVQARFTAVESALLSQTPPVKIWFQPFFNIRDPNGTGPVEAQAIATAQEAAFLKPFAQGAWLFGTGFAPPSGPSSQLSAAEVYSAALRAQGLTFWGSISPGAAGIAHSAPNRYYNEQYGFEGLDHQETSIIDSQQCQDVEIVTGNDRGEMTALTNAPSGPGSPWNYYANSTIPDFWKSTLGEQAEVLYYNQWYKTGVRPTATNDNIFVAYCTQPHGLVTSDPLGAMGPVSTEDGAALPPDTIYVDTDLVKTELLTVTDGPATWTRTVAPGFGHNRFGPYVPGAVSFTLKNPNTGQVLVTLAGEPVVSSAPVYDWVPWTGVAHD